MFQALKKHIMRERQKKKEEQEADAEVERQRLERELKKKQDFMSIEENLEEIVLLEKTLAKLKEEKHQLFIQLKRVLTEDDNRRRQLIRQQECEVNESFGGGYNNVPNESFVNPPMSIQGYSRIIPSEHSLIPPGSLKRARSPSPPHLQLAYSSGYGHSKSPAPPPPARVTYSSSSHSGHSYNNSQYVMSSSASGSGGGSVRTEDRSTPPQRKQPLYLPQAIPARQFTPGIVTSNIHPPRYIQQHGGAVDHTKGMMGEEMFYPIPTYLSTSHVPLHGGGIPIQQPAQGVRTGGITSGFPIRPISSGPPHTRPVHTSSSPHVSSQHNVYVSQPSSMSSSRMTVNQIPTHSHNQTGSTSNRYLQREV